ncbi:hypothetical protein H0A36_07765 [Endozoicomonas sp. SM1973]|uniref:Uncharacterized protein n=1 Tax=Spartinivicinus marinus TaxID=2994442 RepID=A0A853HZX7_9GAMM|nr:hypothetical protein [Spartinivicinus marinus]MCX4029182.1 hypothetical protein [Spartinivicinus marinus]NYZ65909.1 hypothetical protein [Spartinivicinus marinus]
MKKTVVEIYALAVCFFTVACLAITTSVFTWNIIEASLPEFTLSSYEYKCHQSDLSYQDCFSNREKYIRKNNPEIFPTGAELTSERNTSYVRELKAEQRDGFQSMIHSIIVVVISLMIFLVHWRLAIRSRENNG